MHKRKHRLSLTTGATILLTGCTTVAGPTAQADAAMANGPLSLQQQAAQVRENRVEITFPPRRATLTEETTRQLDLLSRLIRDVDPVILWTTAYADGGADDRGDLQLSARRAVAIKHALMARGIPEWQLRVQSVSLPSRGPPREAETGRVTITWGAS